MITREDIESLGWEFTPYEYIGDRDWETHLI